MQVCLVGGWFIWADCVWFAFVLILFKKDGSWILTEFDVNEYCWYEDTWGGVNVGSTGYHLVYI